MPMSFYVWLFSMKTFLYILLTLSSNSCTRKGSTDDLEKHNEKCFQAISEIIVIARDKKLHLFVLKINVLCKKKKANVRSINLI